MVVFINSTIGPLKKMPNQKKIKIKKGPIVAFINTTINPGFYKGL